jgi:Flp pilus assembly protein TadD
VYKRQRQESALEELKSTLRQRVGQSFVNDQEREQIAHLMLSLGNKQDALPIFMTLSEGKPPTSAPMRDVLFLFGPRPDAAAIDWLVARAQNAPASERGDWLRYVLESGAAARVVDRVEALKKPWPIAVRRVYLESLVSLQAWPMLRGELALALKEERSITELVKYAQWAFMSGDAELVTAAWRTVIAVDPSNLDAQREMGLLAYRKRDMVTTISLLTDVVSTTPDRWDLGIVLGDALWDQKRYPEAKRIYRQASAAMKKESNLTRQQRLTQAIVISRLGDQTNARARFKALRTEAPGDANIVAEYASFLMSQGKLDDAVRVLDAQKSAELDLDHAR